jgi:hypothetical protein
MQSRGIAMRLPIILALCSLLPGSAFADGAFAVGMVGNDLRRGLAFGSVINKPSQQEARDGAVADCRTYSNAPEAVAQCKIVTSFKNECLSVALDPKPGPRGFGWGTGPTLAAAQERAIAQCKTDAEPGRREFCALVKTYQFCDGTAQ